MLMNDIGKGPDGPFFICKKVLEKLKGKGYSFVVSWTHTNKSRV